MKKMVKTWFKSNYSNKSVITRLRWAAASLGAITPINALTQKQLYNS